MGMGECLYQNGKNGITSMTHPDATSYCDPAILTHIQMFHTSLLISLDRSLNHNLGWLRLPCCATQASPKSKGSRPKSIWKTSTDPLTLQSHMTSDTNGPNGPNGPNEQLIWLMVRVGFRGDLTSQGKIGR